MSRSTKISSERKKILEEQLQRPARHGVNVARLGLLTTAYSDHLPIKFKFDFLKREMMSWNLLANPYLKNQYITLPGIKLLEADSSSSNYYVNNNKLNQFMEEFARFLYAGLIAANKTIIINKEILEQFVNNVPANLSNKNAIKEARREMVSKMTNPQNPNYHEYQLMILQACQMQEHIATSLQWKSRFDELCKNKALVAEMQSKDILCFQECTEPDDMLKLANAKNKDKFAKIQHSVGGVKDHCVILYDQTRYDAKQIITFELNKTKPCIVGLFVDKESGKEFILGSVHHPGGSHHDELQTILSKMQELQSTANDIPFCIPGDYNNTNDTITERIESDSGVYFHSPVAGTMAGQDYGKVNKAIDGVLTSEAQLTVETIQQPIARPTESQIRIVFTEEKKSTLKSSMACAFGGLKIGEEEIKKTLLPQPAEGMEVAPASEAAVTITTVTTTTPTTTSVADHDEHIVNKSRPR